MNSGFTLEMRRKDAVLYGIHMFNKRLNEGRDIQDVFVNFCMIMVPDTILCEDAVTSLEDYVRHI